MFNRWQEESKEEKVELPKQYKPLWEDGYSIQRKHALVYLYNRGITKDDIIKYSIGFCDEGLYNNRVIIPSYDVEGVLNYFIARDVYKSKFKCIKKGLYLPFFIILTSLL